MHRFDDEVQQSARARWRRRLWAVLRVPPFAVLATASIWRAGQAPAGRRAPEFDWTITATIAVHALSKIPHITWMAVLFLLALLAVGPVRAGLAAVLTFAVGVGWELAETTVIGHHAGVVDLLPDLVAVAVAWWITIAARAMLRRRTAPT